MHRDFSGEDNEVGAAKYGDKAQVDEEVITRLADEISERHLRGDWVEDRALFQARAQEFIDQVLLSQGLRQSRMSRELLKVGQPKRNTTASEITRDVSHGRDEKGMNR